jgi:hypothetical protein
MLNGECEISNVIMAEFHQRLQRLKIFNILYSQIRYQN